MQKTQRHSKTKSTLDRHKSKDSQFKASSNCPNTSKLIKHKRNPSFQSLTLSFHPSIFLSIYESIYPPARPSIHPSIRPSIHPSIRTSIRPSIHLYIKCMLLLT